MTKNNTVKKILFITPYFPPDGGGLERYATEIASGLSNQYEWKIIFLTSGKINGNDQVKTFDGMRIYQLGYSLKFSNTPFSLKWFPKIKKILDNERPDLINIHTPVPGIGNLVAFLSGRTPVVVTYHAGSMKKGNLLTDIPVWIYEHFFLPMLLLKATKIICSSNFLRDSFLKNYKYKSLTITPGTNTKLFKPDLKQKSKQPKILFIAGLGHAEQYKGLWKLITYIHALKKDIPNLSLTVVGDGDMRPEYEKKVSDLGLSKSITFKGKLVGKDLIREYQRADLLALPTTNDNIPTVIIEAMSCSLPVVANDIGAISSLVENNKTGFLIKIGDDRTFKSKLKLLLINKNISRRMGAIARDKAAANFDWSEKILETNSFFRTLFPKPVIAQIVPYYPPHLGGMEVVAEQVSKELALQGYQVKIFTSNVGFDTNSSNRNAEFESGNSSSQ